MKKRRPVQRPSKRYEVASYYELEMWCDEGDEDACLELQLRDLARDVQSENITQALQKLYKEGKIRGKIQMD